MEDFIAEIGKGIFRMLAYFFAEIIFGTVFYWIGFPICKVFSLGRYPCSGELTLLLDDSEQSNVWCSITGLLAVILSVFYFTGQFT